MLIGSLVCVNYKYRGFEPAAIRNNFNIIIVKMLDKINVFYCFLLDYSNFQLDMSINVEIQRVKRKCR